MRPNARFFVRGVPQAQGSLRAFVIKGHAVLTSTNKTLKPWRNVVAETALAEGWGGASIMDGPVSLTVRFDFVRPQSHYGKKGLKASAPPFPHQTGGDLDKLVRAIGDALTGICWRDDRRIVHCSAEKLWGDEPGALISIYPCYE